MKHFTYAAAVVMLALQGLSARADDIAVYINGRHAAIYGPQPRDVDGVLMVPLRDVLQQSGGTVVWFDPDKTAIGNFGATHLKVPIDSETAIVNGNTVRLEMPAFLEQGSTMVPLSFVRDALGARVAWSADTRVVRIDTGNVTTASISNIDQGPSGPIYDNDVRRGGVTVRETDVYRDNRPLYYRTYGPLKVAEHTILVARLDRTLSSDRNVPGDLFTMTVDNGSYGGGFPAGTKIEGVVRDAMPARAGRPGLLELDVKRIIFPNGRSRGFDARCTMSPSETRTVIYNSQGRAETVESIGKKHIRFVGVGPATGMVIATHVKNGAALDAIVNGNCGFVSDEFRRGGAHDVALPSGTAIGIQLDRSYTFSSADLG
jgi:hypothetical protein